MDPARRLTRARSPRRSRARCFPPIDARPRRRANARSSWSSFLPVVRGAGKWCHPGGRRERSGPRRYESVKVDKGLEPVLRRLQRREVWPRPVPSGRVERVLAAREPTHVPRSKVETPADRRVPASSRAALERSARARSSATGGVPKACDPRASSYPTWAAALIFPSSSSGERPDITLTPRVRAAGRARANVCASFEADPDRLRAMLSVNARRSRPPASLMERTAGPGQWTRTLLVHAHSAARRRAVQRPFLRSTAPSPCPTATAGSDHQYGMNHAHRTRHRSPVRG